MTGVLKKKRRQRHEKHTGEGHAEDRCRNWSHAYIRGMIPGALTRRKGHGRISPRTFAGTAYLPTS